MTKEIIDFIYCLNCKGKIDTICLSCYKKTLIEEIDKIQISECSVSDKLKKDIKKLIEVK